MNKLQEETNPKWEKSDFIFVTNTGNSVQSSVFAKSLQRANERLQRSINKHISSHIFRHTMISMLAEYNIPLKAIMDRVGHSDSETTTKIYTHVTKNMKNKAVEVLNHIANSRQS
ncbi:tyrosine-type recombinase/integrase [Streptococcus alactolyticus]|uniref:tyrosine-type recombinase/integrase n=1 Tax=Streptococcus alactolyticus TaxID=29389 RepID=UPI0037525A49